MMLNFFKTLGTIGRLQMGSVFLAGLWVTRSNISNLWNNDPFDQFLDPLHLLSDLNFLAVV